jgi:hypothetical protein
MSETTLLSVVVGVRRALTRLVYVRAALLALGMVLSAWLLIDGVRATRGGGPIGTGPRAGMAFAIALVAALLVSGWLARRRARGINDVRAALWIEERDSGALPASFSLVTLVEALVALRASRADVSRDDVSRADESARAIAESPLLLASASSVLTRTDVPRALRRSGRHQLLGPTLFAGGALTVMMLGALAFSDRTGRSK